MSPLETFAIEYLVELNNAIFNQLDYDKRKIQTEMYNRFYRKLPKDISSRLGIAYPTPMIIDFELVKSLYVNTIKEAKYESVVDWMRRKIWK